MLTCQDILGLGPAQHPDLRPRYVPHVSDPAPQATSETRDGEKEAPRRWPANRSAGAYAVGWARYIDGNVVSDHAGRLITNFLAATMGSGQADDSSEEEESENEDEGAQPLCPSIGAHNIII